MISDYVAEEIGIKLSESFQLIKLGAIYLNKKRQMTDLLLSKGDYVRIHFKPKRYSVDWDFKKLIQNEHEDFLICLKPFKLPSVNSLDNYYENFLEQMSLVRNEKLYPVHRLDQPTTGLMILARSSSAAKELAKLFENRLVGKEYRCLTNFQLETALYTHYMKKSGRSPKEISKSHSDEFSLECKLELLSNNSISYDQSFVNDSLLYPSKQLPRTQVISNSIKLLTGRTHQIRSQLAFLGASILGDEDYMGDCTYPLFALQSKRIWFTFKGQEFNFSYSKE